MLKRLFLNFIVFIFIFSTQTYAAFNPQDVPNNKFGIHILEQQDLKDAETLVNSAGGSWGYLTFVIRDDQKDLNLWETFFRQLRQKNLIPIVRIATHVENGVWLKPKKEEASTWASFLNQLPWPTENRYVVLFNEPNHAKEWGGEINPYEYAETAYFYVKEFKSVSKNFFLLNSGFDLAASSIAGVTADALGYWQEMEKQIPGIFNLFDGWSSHSYPNPSFSSSPYKTGRTSIVGYRFEQDYLKNNFKVEKKPVFITETGWVTGPSGLAEETVASYYKIAYEEIWTDENLIAVTPFLLNYPQPLFASFSWKDKDGNFKQQYDTISFLSKTEGQPLLEPVSLFGRLYKKIKEPPQRLSQIPDPLF